MSSEMEKLLMQVIKTVMKGLKILFFVWLFLFALAILGSAFIFLFGYFGIM